MKQFLAILSVSLCIFFLTTSLSFAVTPPETHIFNTPQGKVIFPHLAHEEYAGGCDYCHHKGVDAGECKSCHGKKKGLLDPEVAYHNLCKECHLYEGGPKKCEGCHLSK